MNKSLVLVSGAIVFKEKRKKISWFVSMQKETGGWEIPKVLVRKGESSVRAALRMMGEKGGMTTRVLEEVGRAGEAATVNGKLISKRHIYYLMLLRSGLDEAIGFENYEWWDYARAVRALTSRREKTMLRQAREVLKKWKRQREIKTNQE